MSQTVQGNHHMEPQLFTAIITGITGLLVVFGGGAKWMLSRMDKNSADEREWQNAERQKLEVSFAERISALEQIIRSQNEEIGRMRNQVASYSRHVGVLEGILRAKGIEVPHVPGALSNDHNG